MYVVTPRNRWQLAGHVANQYRTHFPTAPAPPTDNPSRWPRLQRLMRQLDLAKRHGYQAAARRCREELRECLTLWQQDTRTTVPVEPGGPTVRDICLELQALAAEFGEVQYEPDRQQLSVVTEPIELEGVYLGEFRIVLQVSGGEQFPAYEIEPLEPNWASSATVVSHPHVSRGYLCEGEGKQALQQARRSGRLSDFFLIVQRILTTYNPESAYVPLEEWHGTPCEDCGETIEESELCRCRYSDRLLCDGCSGICEECEGMFAHEYLSACAECDELFCPDCLKGGICTYCHENQEEEIHHETPETLPIPAATAATSPA